MRATLAVLALLQLFACTRSHESPVSTAPEPDFVITRGQEHHAFSRTIPPVIRVHSGAIIEAYTQEASGGLINAGMTDEEYSHVTWPDGFGHPLAGPVYVEGAEPGDILAVTLHQIELEDWGWTDTDPHFAFLADEFPDLHLKTYAFEDGASYAKFSDNISIPLRPFAGVMGVAPDTDEMLSTIPPRGNGGIWTTLTSSRV